MKILQVAYQGAVSELFKKLFRNLSREATKKFLERSRKLSRELSRKISRKLSRKLSGGPPRLQEALQVVSEGSRKHPPALWRRLVSQISLGRKI